ncbi:hypothetical protein ACIA5D_42645 [Actinoplanes sp. NPDC051513]|uniref:hypothetical protein n=1 Tax=Actinoplanes sp. NPDC051513 TaxID=3363908 RepID=UPI0037A16B89
MTQTAARPVLPGPFATPPHPAGVRVTQAVEDLVVPQVQALLRSSPAYYRIDDAARRDMERDLTKIAAYSAALLHDGFGQAERLGQTPVLRTEPPAPARTRARRRSPWARSAADSPFESSAVDRVADVTGDVLGAIDFPRFVADLIKGTFNAIVDASIQQMEAFGELIANVAKTVDQFMADNITDNQARDYLAARYPGHIAVDTGGESPVARARDGAADLPQPNLQGDLGVGPDVAIDDSSVEEVLVPAARRQLASSRHQLLSTMVLMGINRIVVTSGRVRAKLDFHIDASDSGRAETASQFDAKHESSASGGLIGFHAGARTSVAYVQTAKQVASDEINVNVDLSGELDLRFASQTFPLERFADTGLISQIQGGTPNPSGNPVAAPMAPAPTQ